MPWACLAHDLFFILFSCITQSWYRLLCHWLLASKKTANRKDKREIGSGGEERIPGYFSLLSLLLAAPCVSLAAVPECLYLVLGLRSLCHLPLSIQPGWVQWLLLLLISRLPHGPLYGSSSLEFLWNTLSGFCYSCDKCCLKLYY